MQNTAQDAWQSEVDIGLYDRYAPTILAYIYQHIASPQDAEDILVEVFMATLTQQHFSSFSSERQLAWLKRVAHNKVIDRYRHNMLLTFVSIEQAMGLHSREMSPEQFMLQQEKYSALYHALERLSPEQQQLIHLRYGNGLRLTQIADILNKPEKTVSKFLHRTLQRLRGLYEQYEQQEGGKQ